MKNTPVEPKCIFCAKNSDDGPEHVITNEHVIPQMLGGWIKLPILCNNCNSKVLGSFAESKMKQNSYIVAAIDKLKLQPPKSVYNRANITLSFDNGLSVRGKFTNGRRLKLIPTQQSDGSLIVSNEDVKTVLTKKLDRYYKDKGVSIPDIDKFYDQAPMNVKINIPGTSFSFIKKSDSKGKIEISNLAEPIPFIIPAAIALENIAGFSYSFAVQPAFDSFRDWILDDNLTNKVMNHNVFHQSLPPNTFNYQPIHYLRYSIIEDGLVCLVVLFNVLIFTVFMGFNPDLELLPNQRLLDKYIIYDIKDRELRNSTPPDAIVSEDSQFMETMYHLANYELRLKYSSTTSTSSV